MDLCIKCKHLDPFNGGCAAFPDGIPFEYSSGENVFELDPEIEIDEDNEETKK